MPVREALPEIAGQRFIGLLDHVYRSGETYVGRAAIGHAAPAAGPAPRRALRRLRLPADPRRARRGFRHLRRGQRRDGCGARHAGAARERTCGCGSSPTRFRNSPGSRIADGRVHWRNDRWFEFTGMPHEGLEQERAWQKLLPSGRPAGAARRDGRRRSPAASPTRPPAAYGARTAAFRTFYVSAAPLRDSAGSIVQWFGTEYRHHAARGCKGRAAGIQPAQGRVPRHAGARAAQSARADRHRRGDCCRSARATRRESAQISEVIGAPGAST